jgi:FtsP/CotA-like multicopper oxidase with cupredoxin domain
VNALITHAKAAPLAPFVDALPLPSRLIAAEQDGRLTVHIRAGEHRFHRDLPVSSIWGFEGMVPGPTIEAERGHPVTVEWRNELEGPFPLSIRSPRSRPTATACPSSACPA